MALQGRHKSLDKDAKKSIRWLETVPGVKKVILGISESCRHKYSPGFLKIRGVVEGGFKMNSYSGNGVTDIFVHVDGEYDLEHIMQQIEIKFKSS